MKKIIISLIKFFYCIALINLVKYTVPLGVQFVYAKLSER